MATQAEAGKGSAPRKEQDNEAYRNNYDMIFGTKRKTKQDEKDSPRHRDEYETRQDLDRSN